MNSYEVILFKDYLNRLQIINLKTHLSIYVKLPNKYNADIRF